MFRPNETFGFRMIGLSLLLNNMNFIEIVEMFVTKKYVLCVLVQVSPIKSTFCCRKVLVALDIYA